MINFPSQFWCFSLNYLFLLLISYVHLSLTSFAVATVEFGEETWINVCINLLFIIGSKRFSFLLVGQMPFLGHLLLSQVCFRPPAASPESLTGCFKMLLTSSAPLVHPPS